MIAFLQGKLSESLPTRAVVDVQGVGYEVWIPLSTFEKLPAPGANVKLLTHLQIRENEHLLFGFLTAEERDIFKLLITHVTGVGPKLALCVLSGCSAEQLRSAVAGGDVQFLSRIKGMGKKTAERVVVELKDKLVPLASSGNPGAASTILTSEQQKQNDALLALLALGYKQPDALKALKTAPADAGTEEIVRHALKQMGA